MANEQNDRLSQQEKEASQHVNHLQNFIDDSTIEHVTYPTDDLGRYQISMTLKFPEFTMIGNVSPNMGGISQQEVEEIMKQELFKKVCQTFCDASEVNSIYDRFIRQARQTLSRRSFDFLDFTVLGRTAEAIKANSKFISRFLPETVYKQSDKPLDIK